MLKNVNSNGKNIFEKDIVYCTDISMLVNEACSLRKHNLFNSVERVGIDGGQGFFKDHHERV